MAIASSDIGTTKTIREFLSTKLSTDQNYTIKITLGGALTAIENVDVIWDGANYYLAYSVASGNGSINIVSLDGVLPIVLTPPSSTT